LAASAAAADPLRGLAQPPSPLVARHGEYERTPPRRSPVGDRRPRGRTARHRTALALRTPRRTRKRRPDGRGARARRLVWVGADEASFDEVPWAPKEVRDGASEARRKSP